MTIVQSVLFGIVQGITEFLPVSSSGHLLLLKQLWGLENISILYDILLHLATLLAVLIVFRKRLWMILRSLVCTISGRGNEESKVHLRLFWLLVIATTVTAVLGFAIDRFFIPENQIQFVSICFIAGAIVLLATYRTTSSNRKHTARSDNEKPSRNAQSKVTKRDKEYNDLRWKEALVLGFAQGLGVFPGLSRSGMSISTGIFLGIRRELAGEMSFLLAIPAILGATVLKLPDLDSVTSSLGLPAILSGIVVSFFTGLLALQLLLRLIKNGRLHYFAVYLIPLGILGLVVS